MVPDTNDRSAISSLRTPPTDLVNAGTHARECDRLSGFERCLHQPFSMLQNLDLDRVLQLLRSNATGKISRAIQRNVLNSNGSGFSHGFLNSAENLSGYDKQHKEEVMDAIHMQRTWLLLNCSPLQK